MSSWRTEWIIPAGRMRRRTYWWRAISVTIVFAALYTLLDVNLSHSSTLVLYPPFLWMAFVLMSKRLHDSARSAWWLCAVVVPVLGPALLLFWLCFGKGTAGENQYGNDPRTIDADYLTVRISG
jgi:uncharacterized membrane protein YhaH (DUF805 family)